MRGRVQIPRLTQGRDRSEMNAVEDAFSRVADMRLHGLSRLHGIALANPLEHRHMLTLHHREMFRRLQNGKAPRQIDHIVELWAHGGERCLEELVLRGVRDRGVEIIVLLHADLAGLDREFDRVELVLDRLD